MNSIQSIFSPAITEALGWTIVHALWQGFILFIALLISLTLLKKHSAQIRYFISFTALMIFLGWSVSTFVGGYTYAREKQILKNELLSHPDFFKNLSQSKLQNDTVTVSSSNFKFAILKVRAWFQRNFPLFLTIWLLGIGILTIRLLVGLAYTRQLRTKQLLPFEERWLHKLKEFTSVLRISREVSVYKSPRTSTPLTLGFIKPIILFPVKIISGLSDKEVEAIIAHELAHIVRNDYLFNIIQSVIEILFFYHPAIWRISAYIRTEREHACDDIAINLTGDKLTYTQALARANTSIYTQKNLSMGFAHKKGSLLERIKRIQKQKTMKTNISEGLIAACIIISSIFLVSFSVGNQFNERINPANLKGQESQSTMASQITPIQLSASETKAKNDSLLHEVERNVKMANDNDKLSNEIEQAIEIALSEKDPSLSAEIMEEINLALKEISKAGIHDAMKEARIEIEAAFAEINSDSIQEEIRTELKEARKEIKKAMKESQRAAHEMQNTEQTTYISLKAAEAGLKIATEVLENIDIESIVATSLEAAETAIELAGKQIEGLNLDSLIDAQMKITELEIDKAKLSRDREEIERDKEQLTEDLKELKKDMKIMKKELKQELNEIEKQQKNK